jgi:phosphohistidine phosphatase
VSALLYLIQELDDQHARVMLFGHNPEFTDLARFFGCEIDELPTCAIVEMTFEVDYWSEVIKQKPVKVWISTPKQPE